MNMSPRYDNPLTKEYATDLDMDADSRESLLEQSDLEARRRKLPASQSIKIIAIYLISVVSSTLFGLYIGSRYFATPQAVISNVSQYSPVVKEVDMSYHSQQFNGSLMKTNVFRRDAGPEVDAAWESLGVDYRSVRIPASEAAKSGLTPDQVQINDKYGGGYPANVEGLHHLHCLNFLRKSLYFNHEYYSSQHTHAFKNDEHIVKYHLTHCLDIIRQQLMCTVDVGVLGQVWWNKDEPRAYVDFNTQHKCRNFEAVRKWAQEHQLPEDAPEDFLQPPKREDVLPELP